MSSKTEVCNLAISNIGIAKEIANLETEKSNEANACRRYYDTARDMTLRDFAWPFATKILAAALVEENPNVEYKFSYRVPTDSLRIHKILSGTRNDTRQTRVHYKIIQDAAGWLILTDQENAEIEYTVKTDDPAKYTSDFVMAFSYRLGAMIAPRLTGGDPFNVGQKALQMYDMLISKTAATALNEEQPEEDPEAESIRFRE